MATAIAVTLDDVQHVAQLANLQLSPEECSSMLVDLKAILLHVEQLGELDTKNVLPMAQVSEVTISTRAQASTTLRRDDVSNSSDRATIMAAAPESDGRFFKVPKVIER